MDYNENNENTCSYERVYYVNNQVYSYLQSWLYRDIVMIFDH